MRLSALVADLGVRGVWLPQVEAIFDIRVVDTDAPSYDNRSPSEVLKTAEREKKLSMRVLHVKRGMLSLLRCVVQLMVSMVGCEANGFLKLIGERLASKWDQSYSVVMGWIRARLSFAILRATMLCLRGSRSKWRSLGLDDGASLRLAMH